MSPNGTTIRKDFKQYLIEEIEKIFIQYTPRDLYYKVLFELFGNQLLATENDPDFSRQIGRLENSVVYNTLFEFQKKGVLSLIRMLQKYNGAILADAVGLGKTWSALAVIKYFQLQGRETLLLCPKKLEHNWRRYLKHQESRFEKDQFDFFLRFHTDMHENRLETYNDRADKYFVNDKPKLIVIDESHNLRNHKSNRYQFLLDKIIRRNGDVKILLLSATPINNSLIDIRNQFMLMAQGNNAGYEETLGIRNLESTFRTAQQTFNQWRDSDAPKISDFIKNLPANFFTLTDSLIVARTRKMIEGQQTGLSFPEKRPPENLFVTPDQLGNIESFEELFNYFPPMLSGYQPSFYLKEDEKKKNVLYDEKQRDRFLVKMMYILMVKRLESSWFSFYSTIEKIKDHHQNALDKIKDYETNSFYNELNKMDDSLFNDDDDLQDDYEGLTIGQKREIRLFDIDQASNLKNFREDLKTDLQALDTLLSNLDRFKKQIEEETVQPQNLCSADIKLQTLIAKIIEKRESKENNGNPKVVIFTVYRDTAQYLFDQLKNRGFNKLAMVTGSGSKTSDSEGETNNFEPILERFAPYTKLYLEKEWEFQTSKKGLEAYREWINWVAANHPETYHKIQKPIDILIATDALSEGQNLQDADMVVNYDIHWNPVRIIQRMGRIDRLGNPNQKIFSINFWPSNNINTYLNLQGRIEERMAAMKLTGVEVDEELTERFQRMASDASLDQKMNNRMLKQMETTLEDLEGEKSFGFDDLSLERHRQDLLEEFNQNKEKYLRMPNGVYTGFRADTSVCIENGLIALLGYPARPAKSPEHKYITYELIYIDKNGQLVLKNQKEILDALTHHKNKERCVPDAVEQGDEHAIQELADSLKKWLERQANEEPINVVAGLRRGNRDAVARMRQNADVEEKFQMDNFDLITWFLLTANEE